LNRQAGNDDEARLCQAPVSPVEAPQPPKMAGGTLSATPMRKVLREAGRLSLRGTDRFVSAFSSVQGEHGSTLEVTMTTVKCLAVVALLVGGTSLAMAQNGPATGGQPPTAAPAAPAPPGPGVIPHDAPRPQATAPGPNLQSAAPAPSALSGTRIAHRTSRRMYMQAQHIIPGCAMGQPAAATCACGTGASGGPLLCQTGQWCHYPFAKVCTQ
jgi:hypothetical protein